MLVYESYYNDKFFYTLILKKSSLHPHVQLDSILRIFGEKNLWHKKLVVWAEFELLRLQMVPPLNKMPAHHELRISGLFYYKQGDLATSRAAGPSTATPTSCQGILYHHS